MNRRDFLWNVCTLCGFAGISGMLVDSWSRPSPGAPMPSVAPYDLSVARRQLQAIEAQGFPAHDALYWEKTASGLIRCTLCPTFCELRPFERGRCRVRVSLENRLATLVYGRPCSAAVDPIEKKPVFHLLPGSGSFSIATAGCLLGCRYCQNWQISQENPENLTAHDLPPDKVVAAALQSDCRSIAYTYTEPTIFYEYMRDTALLAKEKGLYNVVVSCGYINPEPLRELLPVVDVMKVDLKGFTEKFYRTVCGGSLKPVLDTLEILGGAGKLIDIVTLIVPTLNDDLEENRAMFRWIVERVGPDTCLFLSRFHPTYQLKNLPPTPVSTVETLREEALGAGIRYVYLGNVSGHDGENTYCPTCRKLLIGRRGFLVTAMAVQAGRCPDCATVIPGIWE